MMVIVSEKDNTKREKSDTDLVKKKSNKQAKELLNRRRGRIYTSYNFRSCETCDWTTSRRARGLIIILVYVYIFSGVFIWMLKCM